ncbi:surfeit locus protein 6 [Eucyclogobius newberryi]|uniref:surfeit locus protein 6 n=1 Tax=Eucyclogobius newberryi TaxID=166745 RepID=UPI003B5A00E3
MDLVSKDLYIQKLASRVFSQRPPLEPKKIRFGHLKGTAKDNAPSKKKKKLKNKPALKLQQNKTATSLVTQKVGNKPTPDVVKSKAIHGTTNLKKDNGEIRFSGVDMLRKRLHEKIEASRGQGLPKDASSPEVQAKRAKRKLERERKKRKKKEIQMKKLSEKSELEAKPEIKLEDENAPVCKRDETAIVFNKVETVEEGYQDKILKKKNKKKSLKGQITPLTGKNYKQLLSRVEARKAKLEQLRETDVDKAQEMENKMKWTNLLYKAEGIKIKDDEKMLRVALKRKEKMKSQRKNKWNQRSENVVEKMQHRQDKRKKNIQKRKKVKVEKKKDRARKRGRVLPEDLKKAGI